MEAKIGIIKEFDSLGRLVIPKEIRARYHMDKQVEVIMTEDGVLLRNPTYKVVKTDNETK